MVHHSHGSVFVTKHQLTSTTTLAFHHDAENKEVVAFWKQIDGLLSAAAPSASAHFQATNTVRFPGDAKVKGDRSGLHVRFFEVGVTNVRHAFVDNGDKQRDELAVMLSAMLGCTVHNQTFPYDKGSFEQYFDWIRLSGALEMYTKEKRVFRTGYDLKEHLFIQAPANNA